MPGLILCGFPFGVGKMLPFSPQLDALGRALYDNLTPGRLPLVNSTFARSRMLFLLDYRTLPPGMLTNPVRNISNCNH